MEGEQPQEESTKAQAPPSSSKKPEKAIYVPKKKQDGPKDKTRTQGEAKPRPRPRYTDKARKNAKNKKDKSGGGKTVPAEQEGGDGVLNGGEEKVQGEEEKQNDGQPATPNQGGDVEVGSRLEAGTDASPQQQEEEEDEEEDGWDALFNDDGECLDPHVLEELAQKKGRKKPSVQEARFDYYRGDGDGEIDLREDELSNIVEIYDFPSEFKTEDLLKSFESYQSRGFDIQWVDDAHALGLFSSPIAAGEALRTKHPLLKVRPLSKASVMTKAKARSCSDYLLPAKERPQTSAALARRLVIGALGMKSPQSQEARDAEKRKLQAAKDQKRLAAKQREDAWEGN